MSSKNVQQDNLRFVLAEGIDRAGIKRVQLIRTGTFSHPKAANGQFEVTLATLENMKRNFDSNARRLDKNEIAVDYGHDVDGKAAGWIQALEIDENELGGATLFADIDWTEAAEQAITEREWRFMSADIHFDYKDNETNASLGPTLLGAGLVNRPHVKGMNAVFSEYNNTEKPTEEFSMSPEEMLMKIGDLERRISELEGKNKSLGGQLQDAEKKADGLEGEKVEMTKQLKDATAKLATLTKEKEQVEKEAKFNEYLSEGKVLPAQKDAFMEMSLELSEKAFGQVNLNLKEHGTGTQTDGGKEEKSTEDIIEERAQELMKNNENLTLGEAYSQVMSADPDLAQKHDESTTSVQM